MLAVFVPSFFCVCNQMPWRNLQKIVLPQDIFCVHAFNDLTVSQNLWRWRSISPKAILICLKIFLNFRSDTIEKQGIKNLCCFSSKRCSFLTISLLCFVYWQRCIIVKFPCLRYFRRHFVLVCNFSAFFSSSVNCSGLMSNWPLIISSLGLSGVSGGFSSRFLKRSFHFWSLSFSVIAF